MQISRTHTPCRCKGRNQQNIPLCRPFAAASPRQPAEAADRGQPTTGTSRMLLDCADKELSEACSVKATKEEQAQCWEVHEFYTHKMVQALHSSDDMDRLVDEVANAGSPEQLMRVLTAEKRLDDKAAAGAAVGDSARPSLLSRRNEATTSAARQLFSELDTDGNGVIDREEFLAGMHRLERELNDDQIAQVFSCMDCHGHISPEQFAAIVQEELDMVDPASDAELLRNVHHEPPSWWTQAPHCVTDA